MNVEELKGHYWKVHNLRTGNVIDIKEEEREKWKRKCYLLYIIHLDVYEQDLWCRRLTSYNTFILRLVEYALVRISSPIDYLVTFFQILTFVLDIMFKPST